MKISIDTYSAKGQKTGVGTYINNLINYLKKIDITANKFFLLERREENSRLRKLYKLYNYNVYFPYFFLRNKIKVFHSPDFVLPKIKMLCKYVVTIHDLDVFLHPEHYQYSSEHVCFSERMQTKIKHSVKIADKIITVSGSVKHELMNILDIPESKIKAIYHGTNPNYAPCKNEVERLDINVIKEKYNIRKKYILSTSTIGPRKNYETLIEAFMKLRAEDKRYADYLLVIVGGMTDYFQILKAFCQKTGVKDEVLFIGYISDEDLLKLYQGAELFVYPSVYEGFGIPVLEAMKCGIPVVTSDIPVFKEITGGAALLFTPRNSEELAYKIKLTLGNINLRREYVDKGIKRASKFSWEKMAQETLELYKELDN
ncbi:MAG: glycosyltransferase family 1 protein [bacterium]